MRTPVVRILTAVALLLGVAGAAGCVYEGDPFDPTRRGYDAETELALERAAARMATSDRDRRRAFYLFDRFSRQAAPRAAREAAYLTPEIFLEVHEEARRWIERARQNPAGWVAERMIAQAMVCWYLPAVRGDVPDDVKLAHLRLLVEHGAEQAPRVYTELERIEGRDEEVAALARQMLGNLAALDRMHREDVRRARRLGGSAEDVRRVEERWPPQVYRADGRGREPLNLAEARRRLVALAALSTSTG